MHAMSSAYFLEQMRELSLRYPIPFTNSSTDASFDQRISAFLDRHSRVLLIPFGLALIALTGLIDYSSGPELSFAIFYVVPVAAGAWWGNFSYGVLLSVAATLVWHMVDVSVNPIVALVPSLWNGTVRFSFFIFTSSLVSRLRVAMTYQQTLARTDSLTGVANGRTFYEIAHLELERSFRSGRPFSLAYIDLDNFKNVNDRLGHPAGDAALRTVAAVIQRHTRMLDLLARIGGDEFALLLPETDAAGAEASLAKVRELLLREMAARGWPITFSIGVATFLRPPQDVNIMLRHVDALLYAVKRSGKDGIRLETVHSERPDSAHLTLERRSTVRVLCNCPTRVRPEGDPGQETVFAMIKNLSAAGIGALLESPLPVGTLLSIEPMCNPQAKTLLARVVRTDPDPKGWFHGCELSQQLSSEDIQNWLA
jgi:diguanylate cyclase (GGDEF)-like protein